MKKTIIVLFFLFYVFSNGQSRINLNPDLSGDPWYLDNYRLPTNMNLVPDSKIKEVIREREMNKDTLPYKLSHMFSPHMRPVFVQSGGSCGSASQICYMFGYEINDYRNLEVTGTNLSRLYPSHYTFMTADEHSNQAQLGMTTGIPNAFFYGGTTYSNIYGMDVSGPEDYPDYGWMTGYGTWKNAMKNKLDYNEFIFIDSPEKLEYLKGWIYDHNGDLSFDEGGVAGTGLAISNADIVRIPQGMYAQYKYIMKDWGPNFDHAMTFVGWDDSVAYDFNGDGQITNNVDINNDGVVDMADWERGAIVTLNSWGNTWCNDGMVYIPYRVLKIHNESAEFYHIKKDYVPKLIAKIKMKYSQRKELKLIMGISSDTSAARPEKILFADHFTYQGRADVPMLGRWADNQIHDEPMEFELDFTDLTYGLDITHPYKVFLEVVTKRTGGAGTIYNISFIDYFSSDAGNEYNCVNSETAITDGHLYRFSTVLPGNSGLQPPENIYIPQNKLSVYYVDSQETTAENGRATNVLDGYITTIWHTKYSGGSDNPPHEIQFELTETYNISGFEYTPRRDGQSGAHGRIKDYAIFIGNSPDDWGTPVRSGTFVNTSRTRRIFFNSPVSGKYVRFIAFNEQNNNPWTTMAEFNLFQHYEPNAVDNGNSIVGEFNLEQNYPNPFFKSSGENPVTTIKYSIPSVIARSDKETMRLAESGGQSHNSDAKVQLTVYDILGQKVAILVNKRQSQGNYSVQLNAKNLPSGVYFYRLQVGNFSSTKKMILLK